MISLRQTITFCSEASHLLIVLCLLCQGSARCQTRHSPSDLIQDLVHLSVPVAGSCGQIGAAAETKGAVGESLVSLGASAIPDIEGALDSIEKAGLASEFINGVDWLLIAYARLKGPAAFPRIRRMRADPNLSDLSAVDAAAALSLDLTSYVRVVDFFRYINTDALRDLRNATDIAACSSGFSARFALDILIVAWERGDRTLLEESLGQNPKRALDSLLKDRTWQAVRAELWPLKLSDKTAVGYRFDVGGPGAEPLTPNSAPPGVKTPQNPEFETLFKDGAGKDCGRRRIRFLSPDFLIDSTDIEDLLRLISACAANE